jgi:GNAT superfamily N-acetyltransferase
MSTARLASPEDRDTILTLLTSAFARDPVLRWLCPEDETYPAFAAAFFGGLFDLRIDGGEVWTIAQRAAALWNPPGGNRLPPAVQEETWHRATAGLFTAEADARLARHDALVEGLLPADRGWYLGVVGVDATQQGLGLGRSVLAPVLAAADRARQIATLETATASNLPFYRRLGFAVCGEGEHTEGPHIWCMLRQPAPASSGLDRIESLVG